MTIFDSNIWIAYFNVADTQHKKAVQIFNNTADRVGLPEYILLEVATVLQSKAGKHQADLFLEMTASNEDVEIIFSSTEFCNAVIPLFQKQKSKKLSFVDVSLLLLSKYHTVLTFDRDLKKSLS